MRTNRVKTINRQRVIIAGLIIVIMILLSTQVQTHAQKDMYGNVVSTQVSLLEFIIGGK